VGTESAELPPKTRAVFLPLGLLGPALSSLAQRGTSPSDRLSSITLVRARLAFWRRWPGISTARAPASRLDISWCSAWPGLLLRSRYI
jgi:hypothetical protein